MLIECTLPSPTGPVWYLAYGSNMAHSKFIKDRGLIPLDSAVVRAPGYVLRMNSAGFPYREPAFASISAADADASEKDTELMGVAYLITLEQYYRMLASEGGGIAYREEEVRIAGVRPEDEEKIRDARARSLISVLENEARPSARYMDLLTLGAAEMNFPQSYRDFLSSIPVFHPPTCGYRRVGAALFSSIWIPIMSLMEFITKKLVGTDEKGHSPSHVIALVRFAVCVMWFHHSFHAMIWGRGDGLDEELAADEFMGERRPLLVGDREKYFTDFSQSIYKQYGRGLVDLSYCYFGISSDFDGMDRGLRSLKNGNLLGIIGLNGLREAAIPVKDVRHLEDDVKPFLE